LSAAAEKVQFMKHTNKFFQYVKEGRVEEVEKIVSFRLLLEATTCFLQTVSDVWEKVKA